MVSNKKTLTPKDTAIIKEFQKDIKTFISLKVKCNDAINIKNTLKLLTEDMMECIDLAMGINIISFVLFMIVVQYVAREDFRNPYSVSIAFICITISTFMLHYMNISSVKYAHINLYKMNMMDLNGNKSDNLKLEKISTTLKNIKSKNIKCSIHTVLLAGINLGSLIGILNCEAKLMRIAVCCVWVLLAIFIDLGISFCTEENVHELFKFKRVEQ